MTFIGVRFLSGTGSPEGVVTAPYGTRYYQTDGAAGSRRWIKDSGVGNTGWLLEVSVAEGSDGRLFLTF